jgi:type IV pilus assembly protein PilO
MTRSRQWSLITALLVLGVLAAGWFVVVSPKRSDAAELRSKASAQEQANVSQEQQIAMLRDLAKDLPAQRAKLSVIHRQLPDNPALPTLIRSLSKASKQSGTDLVSLAPGNPIAVLGDEGTPSATKTTVVAGESLYSIPIAVDVTGNFFELEHFLGEVESLRRSMLVRSFDIAPNTSADDGATGELTLTIAAEIFLRSAVPVEAAAPVATTGDEAAAGSSESSSESTPAPSSTTSTN